MENSFLLIIEQMTKKYNNKEELRFILKKRESFWILNVCLLYPDCLNQKLNGV